MFKWKMTEYEGTLQSLHLSCFLSRMSVNLKMSKRIWCAFTDSVAFKSVRYVKHTQSALLNHQHSYGWIQLTAD